MLFNFPHDFIPDFVSFVVVIHVHSISFSLSIFSSPTLFPKKLFSLSDFIIILVHVFFTLVKTILSRRRENLIKRDCPVISLGFKTHLKTSVLSCLLLKGIEDFDLY